MTRGFIGCGTIPKAMLGGILKNEICAKEDVIATAKSEASRENARNTYGIQVTADNIEAAKSADVLVLAVKPIFYEEVIHEIKDAVDEKKIIISIAPGKTLAWLEEQFGKGCRSPFLYLEAWKIICKDMTLLHRLNSFWGQVFRFAARRNLLTEELVMRLAYLSGYEKDYNESIYQALAKGYDQYSSEDTLEAICKYVMKGNPRKTEYFRWFSLAVEHGLRLTRLYEYYVETMDTSRRIELPKALLMYFTYNSDSLGDSKRAFIYSCIIANKEKEPAAYQRYMSGMRDFARKKLAEGKMNESYAVLYQEFLMEPRTKEAADSIAQKMFTHRLYFDDKKVRYVIVRHSQMESEETYTCVQGVAYPRIYTEDAAILFQDDKQRRYSATVDYSLKKTMDEDGAVRKVLALGVDEPGVLLHYCESHELDKDNLDIFQRLEIRCFTYLQLNGFE